MLADMRNINCNINCISVILIVSFSIDNQNNNYINRKLTKNLALTEISILKFASKSFLLQFKH